ncbi:unnamed protein product, partial [marine sediment metagenome]
MIDTSSALQEPQAKAVIDFFSGVRNETPVPPVKSE